MLLEDKGYSSVDLRIRYQKLISFPVYLLGMSILSGLMIINLGKTSNYLKYGVIGVIISIIIYFLNNGFLGSTISMDERTTFDIGNLSNVTCRPHDGKCGLCPIK